MAEHMPSTWLIESCPPNVGFASSIDSTPPYPTFAPICFFVFLSDLCLFASVFPQEVPFGLSVSCSSRSRRVVWRLNMHFGLSVCLSVRSRNSKTVAILIFVTQEVLCSWLGPPLKPATGRSYVPAFSFSGTVLAFTCDCLRFVCAFTRRRKFDLCVSTSSRTMPAFGNNVSFSSSECSTLAFCRR